ncbi:hypothetical protein EDD36DRAFT_230989 [Exophiala viscosa]|uniref:DUF3074 domain-containing protein n=1 Tax=Exophiala viscosa TaxID=2486360 RepID=A0AAN6DYQ4_9EURO|nr:hypothetical protein EDD36DRAFT_230989 [Exophiala viscosa]
MAQPQLSNLVRLAPLQVSDLPSHPDIPSAHGDLATFLVSLLDDGTAFLSPSNFTQSFKPQSIKTSTPSAARVEIHTHSVPASSLAQVAWSESGGGKVARSTPKNLGAGAEHWFARRSVHKDISSKDPSSPGHARFAEFVYGLRDEHSKHEADFTPTLYDAHCVLDWNSAVQDLEQRGGVGRYKTCTLGIYEMCHAIPPPLSPRCFSVLVATASVDEDSFVAVTVPVDLGVHGFYNSGKNVKEGKDARSRKQVCMGVYAAVEVVRRDHSEGEVEWVMATASDAKGNLPMWMQKMSLPGAIAKDVGLFLKWIKTVDDGKIQRVDVPGGEAATMI